MRDHDDGDATLVQFLENPHDFNAGPAVEISGRFVGEQNLWIIDQRARNRDALLLTTRKLTRMMVFPSLQTD